MKNNLKRIQVTALTLTTICLILTQFSGIAGADSVQVISASPGQTITYQGHGSPGATVTMEVTAGISVGVGSDHRYYKDMKGVQIPGGSRFSITASPVDTFSVSGGMHGIGMTIGSVSGNVGSASMSNVPAGTYEIVVTGISNGSSVSMTVHAYQPQGVGSDGSYTVSLSTSGLPPAVYSVKQDGQEVAKVYLGVPAPATPTPTAAPTAAPTAGGSSGGASNGMTNSASNITITPMASATINETPNVPASPAAAIWISPTAQPGSGGQESIWTTIALLAGGVIAGLLVGYIVVFVVHKK